MVRWLKFCMFCNTNTFDSIPNLKTAKNRTKHRVANRADQLPNAIEWLSTIFHP